MRGDDVEINKQMLDELIALMRRDGLDRLRVAFGDLDLDLSLSASAPAVPASAPNVTKSSSKAEPPAAAQAPANVRKVQAPLVGVFYRSPAPGAKPYVEVGDAVVAGQTLCILEAMKLMNEIVSEHSGKIGRICVKDGELVALHQEMFWIET